VTVPDDIDVDATRPDGATVSFAAGATDAVGVTSFGCAPPSGSTFPIGTTTVTCTATDSAGNSSHKTFAVHVRSAAEQLENLVSRVEGTGPGKSLEAKLASGRCNSLAAFVNEVNAQRGKKLGAEEADSLAAAATNIRATLGC